MNIILIWLRSIRALWNASSPLQPTVCSVDKSQGRLIYPAFIRRDNRIHPCHVLLSEFVQEIPRKSIVAIIFASLSALSEQALHKTCALINRRVTSGEWFLIYRVYLTSIG